ncbi:MAG: hydrogenase, partial [Myxococcaceae bacterium]
MAETAHAIPLDPLEPRDLVAPHHDDKSLNETLLDHVWRKPGKGWFMMLGLTSAALGLLVIGVTYTLARGIGVWGNNQPVGWAFDIINFVWWVGIGHAGTLISAILLLFQQKWRTSINRFAEAMTLFAVMCAGLFPLLHTGRPWFAFWLFPYPSTLGAWPQFRSPLVWDVFAISTYLTVSALFWFVGLIPDLAALRDSSKTKLQRTIYGLFALGWRGSGRHWHNYKIAYLLLAGLSTPLVVSVHTIVSFDFAVSQLPGWHATIFPPYFVAGAVFSGFAMVITLIVPARKYLGLRDVITDRHLENM